MASTVSTSLSNLPAVTGQVTPTAKNTLDKDSFLRLLTTQLQKQDPLSPMDSNAFVAQLAQFSSVEALENMGKKLDTLALGQANANQMAVPQMIGKEVLFSANKLGLTKGQTGRFSVTLDDAAANTVAIVSDAAGRPIRTLQLGAHDAGSFSVTWDGCDKNGQAVDSGQYFLTIAAAKLDGTQVAASTSARAVPSMAAAEVDSKGLPA